MNKLYLAGALGFGCGVLLGSAVTYIFCKRKQKKTVAKSEPQIVASYDPSTWIKAEEPAKESASVDISVDPAEFEHPEEEDDADEYVQIIRENYDAGVRENDARAMERRKHSGPYLINADEVGEYRSYDDITLYYYAGDGVLTAEDDTVIVDYSEIIGDCLDAFANGTAAVFVRNPGLGADYRIIKVDAAYADSLPED